MTHKLRILFKVLRHAAHFLAGAITALAFITLGSAGFALLLVFVIYEFSEYLKWRDFPVQEMLEYSLGLYIVLSFYIILCMVT